MRLYEPGIEDDAIDRLYQLALDGDTGSGEFARLDHLVYDGLARAYGCEAAEAA